MAIQNAGVAGINYLTELEKVKYSRKVREFMAPILVMQTYAQVPDILASGEGLKLRFTRRLPYHSNTRTNISDGTAIDTAARRDALATNRAKWQQFDVEGTLYFDFENFNLKDTKQAFVSYVNGASQTYGEWYAEEVDFNLATMVSKYGYLMRADLDTAYTVDSAATSDGTTTTLVDTVLTQADDYWNGGTIVFTSGWNMGLSGVVTDFDALSDTVTFTPANKQSVLPYATKSGDTYHICTRTGLVATDVITLKNVKQAVGRLRTNKAKVFQQYGKTYVGIIDADVEIDLGDAFVDVGKYSERGIKQYFDNEIGTVLGVRWVRATNLYRTDANGVASTTGVVRHVLIVGSDAYGTVPISAASNKPRIIIHAPKPDDESESIGSLGVKVWEAPVMLNAMSVVVLMCGATAIA